MNHGRRVSPDFRVEDVSQIEPQDLHMLEGCRTLIADVSFASLSLPVDDLVFTCRNDGVVLIVDIRVTNRDKPDDLEWIHVWRTLLCPWSVLRSNGPEYLVRWMRETIQNTLAHEVDESITIRGQRVFDPHRALVEG